MKSINFLHRNCRNAIYPQSDILRFQIPDSKVKWDEQFSDYLSKFHESSSLVGKPWADSSIGKRYLVSSREKN